STPCSLVLYCPPNRGNFSIVDKTWPILAWHLMCLRSCQRWLRRRCLAMAGKAKPVVTIGIPFFNPGPLIEDAVRSVFSQTFSDWELILLDDGSTDESLRRVQQIRDPRVKVYSDGRNKGLVTRLNEITQLASGKYLARM